MKKMTIIFSLLLSSFVFATTTMDYLVCRVVQPAVDNPNVAIIYSKELSDSVIAEAELAQLGVATVLYAAHITSANGSEYNEYLGLSEEQYNETDHLLNAEGVYYIPNSQTGVIEYILQMVPVAPFGSVDSVIGYVYDATAEEGEEVEPLAVLSCVQAPNGLIEE